MFICVENHYIKIDEIIAFYTSFVNNRYCMVIQMKNSIVNIPIKYDSEKCLEYIVKSIDEKKKKNEKKKDELTESIKTLNELLQYSPPTAVLPNGGTEYQSGKQEFYSNK